MSEEMSEEIKKLLDEIEQTVKDTVWYHLEDANWTDVEEPLKKLIETIRKIHERQQLLWQRVTRLKRHRRLFSSEMKVCHLVLEHKWYDLIKAREKDVEFRDNTEYWRQRILDAELVKFSRGYTKESMTFDIDYLVVPKPEEIDEKIEIHLGSRIS